MIYILNRLLSIALTLVLISIITFAVTNILPGDVAMMVLGTQSNPAALAGLARDAWASTIRWSCNTGAGSAAC